jgi:hypothetical protein
MLMFPSQPGTTNTLRQRTAALARWHKDRGFDDAQGQALAGATGKYGQSTV